MISSVYHDDPPPPPASLSTRSALALELRDYVVAKSASKVWATVLSSLLQLLVALGALEAFARPSALAALALAGMYGVYSERRVSCHGLKRKRDRTRSLVARKHSTDIHADTDTYIQT